MSSYEERSAKRPDQYGKHRSVFESNKKKILATQTVCGRTRQAAAEMTS